MTPSPRGKVLVTGALGFIGSHLSAALLEAGWQVIGVDNFLTGDMRRAERFKRHEHWRFEHADVNEWSQIYPLFLEHVPDLVFHYAACVGVKRTLEHPAWVLKDIKGLENILELGRMFRVQRVFFSSSSEVYGEPVEFPQNESTTPLNSKLPYAVVKNLGEVMLRAYRQEHGLPYTIFRFFNTYGPWQSEDFVVTRFIRAALAGRPLRIYGDGSQSRTFCFIQDNIRASLGCLENPSTRDAVLNIGSADEVSVLQLAQHILQLTGSPSKLEHVPALAEGDMTRRLPDNRRMLDLLGQTGLLGLEEGLRATIDWAREHPETAAT